MRFLSYARKSTDAAANVNQQIELCHAYIKELGGEIGPDFKDNDVSGAEFNRPGLKALLTALRQGDGLVMMDASRLGREQSETLALQVKITGAGVRIFHYQNKQELKVGTATEKLMAQIPNFGHEHFREEIREKTKSKMYQKVREGETAGMAAYGYRNVGALKSRRREIDPEQAKVVIRIFELYAHNDLGPKAIARILNDERVPAPRGLWSKIGIRKMLRNELYAGTVVYGRTRRVSKRRAVTAPAGEWERVIAPELRILPQPLWKAAQARHERTLKAYPSRTPDGQLRGRAPAGVGAYLLSGMLFCAACGSPLIVISRARREGVRKYWLCGRAHRHGVSACSAQQAVGYEALTGAVVDTFKATILSKKVLDQMVADELDARRRAPDAAQAEVEALTADVAKLNRTLEKLTDAVIAGGDAKTLVTRMKTMERERDDLAAKLEHAQGMLVAAESFDTAAWMREQADLLGDLRHMVELPAGMTPDQRQRYTAGARRILKVCLPDGLTVTREPDGVWTFKGVGRFVGNDLQQLREVNGRIEPAHSRIHSGGGESLRRGRPRSSPTLPRENASDSVQRAPGRGRIAR
jgi:site-specific DNA recombinase